MSSLSLPQPIYAIRQSSVTSTASCDSLWNSQEASDAQLEEVYSTGLEEQRSLPRHGRQYDTNSQTTKYNEEEQDLEDEVTTEAVSCETTKASPEVEALTVSSKDNSSSNDLRYLKMGTTIARKMVHTRSNDVWNSDTCDIDDCDTSFDYASQLACDWEGTSTRCSRRSSRKRSQRGRIVASSEFAKQRRTVQRKLNKGVSPKATFIEIRLRHKDKKSRKSISPTEEREQPGYISQLQMRRLHTYSTHSVNWTSSNTWRRSTSDSWRRSTSDSWRRSTSDSWRRSTVPRKDTRPTTYETRQARRRDDRSSDFEAEYSDVLICPENEQLRLFLEELQEREITPEDYDRLLELESLVAPKTIDESVVEDLPCGWVYETRLLSAHQGVIDAVDITHHDCCIVCMEPWNNETTNNTIDNASGSSPSNTVEFHVDTQKLDKDNSKCSRNVDEAHTDKFFKVQQTEEKCIQSLTQDIMYNVIDSVCRPVTILPCNHIFHKDCIEEWLLNRSMKCPIDNQLVFSSP